MLVFENANSAKIQAYKSGTTDLISVDGVTSASTTPDNAATQVNKLLGIAGLTVVADGMRRILTEEAIDNG